MRRIESERQKLRKIAQEKLAAKRRVPRLMRDRVQCVPDGTRGPTPEEVASWRKLSVPVLPFPFLAARAD